MSDIAIRCEELSKWYRIGGPQEKYRTLRDSLTNVATAPLRALRMASKGLGGRSNSTSQVCALKDISFEIKRGEVVGIIGPNGAGKSTLLKVLSRITEPTTGHADIHGRVGSLLEVGTGFHHELSGRENIYLNGAIIGMRRGEIESKFDEIVAFAEVERFIDTPVKHYSSGMYLRLAFSVAAHLEPEILLVDEVLAVGDVAFQKKCMGKMEDVAAHGRTVLFVSHNLGAIKELCQTSIVLSNGALDFQGSVVEGLGRYSQSLIAAGNNEASNGTFWRRVCINDNSNGNTTTIASGEPFFVDAWLTLSDDIVKGQLFCIVNDSLGNLVVHQRVESDDLWSANRDASRYRLRVELPPLWLAPSVYTLYFKFLGVKASGECVRHLSERIVLDVTGNARAIGRSYLAPPTRWTFQPDATATKPNGQRSYSSSST